MTGCMPDSLTKFNKDEVKKAKPASTTSTTDGTVSSPPVVDTSGVAVVFDPPTFFSYGDVANNPVTVTTGSNFSIPTFTDGSLSDPSKQRLFFERCDLVTAGVDAQSAILPARVSLNATGAAACTLTGSPTTPKSVVTAFCSDNVSTDQATCEANPLVWNGTTCSNPDKKFTSAAACTAGFHTWYDVGDPVPYRIRLTYHNAEGIQSSMTTTMTLGIYQRLTSLSYTQAEKLLLKVTGSEPLANVIPLLTTTATTGAYAKNNIITSNAGVGSVAKFVDSSLSFIGVNKLIPIKVTSTTPFILNTFITKSGDATKVGKIFKIDAANRILYVENISANNKYFVAAESICSNSITGVCGTSYPILEISESYIMKSGETLDNDKQYYSNRYGLATPVSVFEVGTMIKPISPIQTTETSSANGVKYTISPALPCNDPNDTSDCVSLDETTGNITGTFSSFLQNTEFTLTATNPVSSTSTKLNLSAIVGPSELAITTNQIITVSSTTSFKEGENLIQPIAPPLTEGLRARIVKILNGYQMAIETFNGVFIPGVSLDNNNSSYQSEKAFIIPYASCTDTNYTTQATCEGASYAWAPDKAVHYNVSVTINSSGDYVAGDNLTSAAGSGIGATGKVVHVFTAARDELFVQYFTQSSTSTAAAPTFYEGDTLDAGAVVYQIQNGNMKTTLASTVSFLKGSDVVSSTSASGYTQSVVGSVLSIGDISKINIGTNFKIGQTLFNHETQTESSASSAITAVTHNNYLIFERGKTMYATANINSGNGIIYSITPALPAGLSLNTANGTIFGTATGSSIKKDYILKATNFIGSASYVVAIEVKDYFEVIQKTGASSALLHKVGDYQTNRKCRVDATDITALSNGKALDIRCFLDMEEQDLFQTDLKLNLFTGAGICQYIRYEPYYFYSWQPNRSVNVSSKYPVQAVMRSGCSNLQNSGTIPSSSQCDGNYSSVLNPTYPNCDEGSLTYYSETYSQDATTGSCTLSAAPVLNTVNCSGKRINCISGAVKDTLGAASLELGNRNQIISASSGINFTYTHASPISKGDELTNIRLANGTVSNQCTSSAADTLAWKNATALTSNRRVSPFASDSNPFYTVSCLDAAQDVKARIRVIVRDWDRTFNIENDIFNQSFTVPPANMNNIANDPIFNSPYNDIDDLDNNYSGTGAAAFTAGTCGSPAAGGSCTNIAGIFASSADCTGVGGTLAGAASCSDGAYTTYRTCVSSGNCSNPADTDAGLCAKGGGTWTPNTWTAALCTFNNQNQCEYYGGTWTGDQMYKFPNSATTNILGI